MHTFPCQILRHSSYTPLKRQALSCTEKFAAKQSIPFLKKHPFLIYFQKKKIVLFRSNINPDVSDVINYPKFVDHIEKVTDQWVLIEYFEYLRDGGDFLTRKKRHCRAAIPHDRNLELNVVGTVAEPGSH